MTEATSRRTEGLCKKLRADRESPGNLEARRDILHTDRGFGRHRFGGGEVFGAERSGPTALLTALTRGLEAGAGPLAYDGALEFSSAPKMWNTSRPSGVGDAPLAIVWNPGLPCLKVRDQRIETSYAIPGVIESASEQRLGGWQARSSTSASLSGALQCRGTLAL
jgi:hypothetical protein